MNLGDMDVDPIRGRKVSEQYHNIWLSRVAITVGIVALFVFLYFMRQW